MQNRLPQALYAPHGKRAVLLLHAYSGSSNDVRMLARSLEKQNYTVYAPIFAGHATPQPRDILEQQPEQWHRETQAALTFLHEEGYQEVAVFGLSMGGIFAMRALIEEESVLGGGSFCSPIVPVKTQVPMYFELYIRTILEKQAFPEKQIEEEILALRPLIYQQLKKINEQADYVAKHLEAITRPIFLAQAGRDEMIDPKGVFQIAELLTNTQFTLQWYPESTHVITVGEARKQLEQDVATFLNNLPWNEE